MIEERSLPPGDHAWKWTLASGVFTLLLAAAAFLLPVAETVPKGGVVGWLLLLAGLAEFTFGWKRGLDRIGKAAVGSGAITALAGLLFVANPLADYFPVANVVMAWLLVRGSWVLAMGMKARSDRLGLWLVLSGAVDVLLGILLLVGLQLAVFVIAVFGPTREVVAQFALILAFSFIFAAVSQIAVARLERRRSRPEV
jgi:uncharacterized membrane protein HdeD (DUF308 family)